MNDLVSIVIPVYNIGNRLYKSIESIKSQDYDNIEIILVDDGSKDDSPEICDELANHDQRIRVVHTENRGSGPARNVGIENSKGRFIYFPDADDRLVPNAIRIMVDAMNDGADLVVFGFKNLTPDGSRVVSIQKYVDTVQIADDIRNNYSAYLGSEREFSIQGAPWNKLFDLDVIKRNHVEYPPLRRHQDEAFIGRYMCYATKVHFISDILYEYTTNDLKREWTKFPKDYIDAVTGLYKIRQETILAWNENDIKTHDCIVNEYICKMIRALELSYSPKMGFNAGERKQWLIEKILENRFDEVNITESLGRYQSFILHLIKGRKYQTVLFIFWIKVQIEKSGMLEGLKKWI